MRTPPSAGLAEVELYRAGKQSGSSLLGARQPALWGAALGGSLALLLVRLSFTWGGPAALAGPAIVGLAGALGAFLGMLAGLALTRPPAGRRRVDTRRVDGWALGLGVVWLLILYPAVGPPAIIAVAGFSLALLAGRAVGRGRSVAGISGRSLILAGGVGLTALVLYWPRLARQVVPGDSGEFQALIPSLGIPHPTGYPLYVLVGKVFTLLPLGEPAFSLSLLSALWAAATAAGIVLLALDLGRDEVAAGLAAGLVALSPLFVQQAIVPEVYALHLMLLVFILWLTGRWQRSRSPVTGAWIALLVGLGLAHHRTSLLIIPSLIVAWLVAGRPPIRARIGLAWVLIAALPLVTYLYFPWRWPVVTGRGITAAEFRALVFADRFQTLVDPAQLWSPERYALLVTLLTEQLTGVGLLLGLIGLTWAVARRPAQWLPLATLALASLCFAAVYRVPDVAVFLLPVQLVLALGAAAAVRSLRIGRSGLARGAGTLALGAIVLHQIGGWRSATALPDVQAETEAAISAVPPGPALIISDVERFTPLLYASRVVAGRRDIEVIMPDTHEQAFELIEAARGSNRAVLLARHLPRLTDRYSVQSAGPLVTVDPAPVIDPGPVTESAAATYLRLARATVPERARRGDQLRVELEWWLEQPIVEAWRPVLALADADGRIRAAEVARDPVAGLFPFPLWQAGQRVRDYHQVALPDDLPTGRYDLWLLLLRPGERTPERVSDYLPGGDPLATVHVEPSYQAPDGLGSTLLAVDGDLRLLDYRLPATVEAGRPAELQLLWQAGSRTPARRVLVELGPGAGPPVGADALLPALTPGETLVTRVTLPAVGVGLWPLHLMVEEAGHRLPIRGAWYQPAERSAELATLQVVPPAPTVPTFDDRIQLLGAEHPSDVTIHDTVALRLRWQAIAAPRSDYTVFVHLVDEQGVVRAQVDSRPRQGTLPTTQWPLATVIDDRYEVPLRDRVPPGQYRLVIGLYDARTMIRLPVTDPDGRPIADHLDLGGVSVTGSP